jgi:hypothetical protein
MQCENKLETIMKIHLLQSFELKKLHEYSKIKLEHDF